MRVRVTTLFVFVNTPSIMPTFATKTRSSRLPVQELVDAILDYLHDRKDLAACALVSHSFCHRAQSRLFRDIALDNGKLSRLVNKAQRLADILSTSPHIVDHIRTIRINTVRCQFSATSAGRTCILRHSSASGMRCAPPQYGYGRQCPIDTASFVPSG